MKSRISKKLHQLQKQNQKAFIPYITAGYPDLDTTKTLIKTLEQAGASMIELGVPFTDPMADGPVIQRANEEALKKGVTLHKILKLVKDIRKTSQIPILLMGYYNPIFQYGLKNFAHDCHESGIDGCLVVDLPPEEAKPLKDELKKHPIDLIFLLTPTSREDRILKIKKLAEGFVYYVSLTGITGAGNLNPKAVKEQITRIRKHIKLPINIGFGISKPEHVKQLAPLANGVIVGSSIIKIMLKNKNKRKMVSQVEKYVKGLVRAL